MEGPVTLDLALTVEPTLAFLLSLAQRASPAATARKFSVVHPPMTFPVASGVAMIGPSAGKLGGNLKNQYWLLQEAALPEAK